MITHSTQVVNNQFQVTFDFTPKDVRYSRNNYTATHKGAGTSHRHGIWEGLECINAQIQINDGAWQTYSLSNNRATVTVNSNNAKIKAFAKYRLRTMGHHWLDTSGRYPFFWYGNVGGVEYNYNGGSFRNSKPVSPNNQLHTVHACVPADWRHTDTQWSDWAYINGKNTSNWHKDNGRYEQRNGNAESANNSNGWISDSNRKQAYRKSCMFFFEKDFYSNDVWSSGIATDPYAPELTVHAAKGDSGQVTLKYLDPSNYSGRVKLTAYCADKAAGIDDFHISGHFGNGGSYTYTIDFNSIFGEAYRANDVYYEAWSKNDYGYISPSTGRKGIQRYNGRPYIPNNLRVESINGLIYNSVIFRWDASSDPDGDYVVYDIWVKAINPNGSIIRDDFISRGHSNTSYQYDISNFPDGTEMIVLVRASDNLITSNWSQQTSFKKGAKPNTTVALLSPIKANNDIYSIRPRFCFEGWDGESNCHIQINGQEYNSYNNSDMFNLEGNKFMFKPNFDIKDGNITIKAFLKNPYGEGTHTQVYSFNKKLASERVVEGEIIKAFAIKEIQQIIINMAKAYNITASITEVNINDLYKASFYNDCLSVVNQINLYINQIIKNDKFDYTLIAKEVNPGQINDDLVWEQLILDITNI